MRRFLPALCALLAGVLLLQQPLPVVRAASAAQATDDDLAAAVLSAAEVGSGFSLVQSGPVDQLSALGIPSAMAAFMRTRGLFSFQAVAIVLAEGSAAGDTDDDLFSTAISTGLEGMSGTGFEFSPSPAPAIGQGTVKYALTGTVYGFDLAGEVVLWRHGTLVAGVVTLGTRAPGADAYAAHQEAKLTAIFDPLS